MVKRLLKHKWQKTGATQVCERCGATWTRTIRNQDCQASA